MVMDDKTLVKMTQATFTFLEKELSIKLKNIEQKGNGLYILQYRNKKANLGIDIELESRDIGVYVILVGLKNGIEPEDYLVNKSGEIVREHLFRYLLKLNELPSGHLKETRNKYREIKKTNIELKRYEIFQQILDLNVILLKNNIHIIKH